MARKGVKASKFLHRKSKAKVIEWTTQEGPRGARNIPIEVGTLTNLPTPRQDAGRMEIDNHGAILDETNPPSMDVDETIWIEGPAIPEQMRVSLHTCPSPIVFYMFSQSQHIYMEEFIPRIGPYLHCLLNSEGVPAMTMCQSCMSAPFEWRCTDCFPALVLCKECCRKSHNRLPFHRVQKWTGKYFMPSWLREVGIRLHLGHSGDLCPIKSVRCQPFYFLNPIPKNTVTEVL